MKVIVFIVCCAVLIGLVKAESKLLCVNGVCPSGYTCNCNTDICEPVKPCTDASSNCVNWVKNGFCHNTFYTPEQRKKYCAKSCNLC
uniref:ShKT domain-containing protein n=1 Tax=Panagrolaimus sp. PS1159 TaxID=55785 RepID=A0AC35GIB8_9BILA